MRRSIPVLVNLAAGLFVAAIAARAPLNAGPQCNPAADLVPLSDVPEASGLVASPQRSGTLWALNDSGRPELIALDTRGKITGRVRVDGAAVDDWEGIAVGPCGAHSCLYIGDIGDNAASRPRITVYRAPEPAIANGTVTVSDVFHATYPDGPHDAEALFLAGGRLYIVTKGETGPVALYRFPADLQTSTTMRLERVGGLTSKPDARSRITDAAVTPDGQWVALRSRSALVFYRTSDLVNGQWRAQSTIDLTPLKEPQGEGIAFDADGTVYLAGEGGGKGRAGTFARFPCPPPS